MDRVRETDRDYLMMLPAPRFTLLCGFEMFVLRMISSFRFLIFINLLSVFLKLILPVSEAIHLEQTCPADVPP